MLQSTEDWAKILKCRAIRGNKTIKHHIFSSFWSGIKPEFSKVIENSYWLVGDGGNINFWKDAWCGDPIQERLQLSNNDIQPFPLLVKDYISNGQWCIPNDIASQYPNLLFIVMQVIIPIEATEDRLVWKHNSHGDLSLADSYAFIKQPSVTFQWAKNI